MTKWRFRLFKHDFLINQLMQLYSVLLVIISIIIMLVLTAYTGADRFTTSGCLCTRPKYRCFNGTWRIY